MEVGQGVCVGGALALKTAWLGWENHTHLCEIISVPRRMVLREDFARTWVFNTFI